MRKVYCDGIFRLRPRRVGRRVQRQCRGSQKGEAPLVRVDAAGEMQRALRGLSDKRHGTGARVQDAIGPAEIELS